ncbi:MAG: biotin--[acetyl-CoA-carboxylase] ligase [Gemmatimonadota bacterium]|nr:biotin--[acetyl-CoA-carboxylase] ligase [Gemmatimonadota bacterium]
MAERQSPGDVTIGRPLLRRNTVTSTMDELADLARAGATEGTTLLADFQTAGRGRSGRVWDAPAGTSLLFSVLLRPRMSPERLTPLSILTAACVAEVVETITGLHPAIKWPNDVLIHGRKCCGILTRVTPLPGEPPITILGVGFNVNSRAEQLPPEATSLFSETGHEVEREPLLDAFLSKIGDMYAGLVRDELGAWWPPAIARLAYVGETVVARDGKREILGTLVGVAPSGALLLREENGQRHTLASGELVRGPHVVSLSDSPPL